MSGRFGRVEVPRRTRITSGACWGPVGRTNSWQLAECAGHNGPYGLQHLLSRSRWDPDELRDDVQEYVAQRLGAPDGVLLISPDCCRVVGAASVSAPDNDVDNSERWSK